MERAMELLRRKWKHDDSNIFKTESAERSKIIETEDMEP